MMRQSIAASITSAQAIANEAGGIMATTNLAASADVLQFDLTNPIHLSIRRLLADVYARHAKALDRDRPLDAAKYRGMGQGIERVVIFVLCDPMLGYLCASLNCALNDQLSMYQFKDRA